MHIEFDLNEKQAKVLEEIMGLPNNKGRTANEACKNVVIEALIGAKQRLIAEEMVK